MTALLDKLIGDWLAPEDEIEDAIWRQRLRPVLAAAHREGWDAALAAVRDEMRLNASGLVFMRDLLDRLAAEGPKP